MKQVVWLFKWLLKAAIFFTLFAFALNNQGDATVYFFFGYLWTAPMVLIVLCAFACGLVIGIMGMVPRWWRHRRAVAKAKDIATAATNALIASTDKASTPRPDGL